MKPASSLLVFLFISTAWCQQKNSSYPLVNFKTLSETTADTVLLQAYVLDVYVCPPCPPGAMCKPCIENHCTVVEEKPIDIMKIPLGARVRIFSEHPEKLEAGKQYLFIVRFRNKKVSPKDNLTLISFKKL